MLAGEANAFAVRKQLNLVRTKLTFDPYDPLLSKALENPARGPIDIGHATHSFALTPRIQWAAMRGRPDHQRYSQRTQILANRDRSMPAGIDRIFPGHQQNNPRTPL